MHYQSKYLLKNLHFLSSQCWNLCMNTKLWISKKNFSNSSKCLIVWIAYWSCRKTPMHKAHIFIGIWAVFQMWHEINTISMRVTHGYFNFRERQLLQRSYGRPFLWAPITSFQLLPFAKVKVAVSHHFLLAYLKLPGKVTTYIWLLYIPKISYGVFGNGGKNDIKFLKDIETKNYRRTGPEM